MREILDHVRAAVSAGKLVYLHCRAGIGRTNLVVGCLLAERGLSGPEALLELNRLWQQSARAVHWPAVPETAEQTEYVRNWSAAAAEADPLLEPAALAAARGLRERFQGALLGLAVGDAVAAATQYRRPGRFTPVGDMLGGGPFDLPRGAWSDDTAMALCLAESLLERERLRCARPGGALPPLAARRLPVGHRPVSGNHGEHRAGAGDGAMAPAGFLRNP